MISINKINELYDTISSDLSIVKYTNETVKSYKNRLVYSALGKWILSLFTDRDFEDVDDGSVSKTHVTISAMSILEYYKKMDDELAEYFIDDKRFVNLVENVYLKLGYIKSGSYCYKRQNRNCKLAVGNKTLDIDADSIYNETRGLGSWINTTENDIKLDVFLLVKDTAEVYTRKLLSQLKFVEFNADLGKNEIYNVYKNKWEKYSRELASLNEFSIIKVDEGLDYQIIKFVGNVVYTASLPTIYTKQSVDSTFMREIWRIILGICSINGSNAKCNIKNNGDESITFGFKGFVLPCLEDAIIRCMCWPVRNCFNRTEFITDNSMKQAIIDLLTRLSIEIHEEK